MKTLMTFILSVGVVALYTMQGISATSGAMSSGKVETRKAVFVLAPSTETELKGAKDNVVMSQSIGDHCFLDEDKNKGVFGRVGPSRLERGLSSEGSGKPMAVAVPAQSVRYSRIELVRGCAVGASKPNKFQQAYPARGVVPDFE